MSKCKGKPKILILYKTNLKFKKPNSVKSLNNADILSYFVNKGQRKCDQPFKGHNKNGSVLWVLVGTQ